MTQANHEELPTFWAVIPAAGKGTRMNAELPKQYLKIHNKTILEHTLSKFLDHPIIHKIVVVVSPNDSYWQQIPLLSHEKILVTTGGDERHLSVANALTFLQPMAKKDDWVMVHDAVRPCICREDIDHLITTLQHHPLGGILGIPIFNTLKRVNENSEIISTVVRTNIWQALTPQMFRFQKLKQALHLAITRNVNVTDESGAIELLGEWPQIVQGRSENIKITKAEDLAIAQHYLE